MRSPFGDQAGVTADVSSAVRNRTLASPFRQSTVAIRLFSHASRPSPAETASVPSPGANEKKSSFTKVETANAVLTPPGLNDARKIGKPSDSAEPEKQSSRQ
jgi:hypothetical protein